MALAGLLADLAPASGASLVGLIAAGPLVTRAASAIPGFDALLASWAHAPIAWDPTDPAPVADAACFLLSDMAAAVTGEILHVDGGRHAVEAGVPVGAELRLTT